MADFYGKNDEGYVGNDKYRLGGVTYYGATSYNAAKARWEQYSKSRQTPPATAGSSVRTDAWGNPIERNMGLAGGGTQPITPPTTNINPWDYLSQGLGTTGGQPGGRTTPGTTPEVFTYKGVTYDFSDKTAPLWTGAKNDAYQAYLQGIGKSIPSTANVSAYEERRGGLLDEAQRLVQPPPQTTGIAPSRAASVSFPLGGGFSTTTIMGQAPSGTYAGAATPPPTPVPATPPAPTPTPTPITQADRAAEMLRASMVGGGGAEARGARPQGALPTEVGYPSGRYQEGATAAEPITGIREPRGAGMIAPVSIRGTGETGRLGLPLRYESLVGQVQPEHLPVSPELTKGLVKTGAGVGGGIGGMLGGPTQGYVAQLADWQEKQRTTNIVATNKYFKQFETKEEAIPSPITPYEHIEVKEEEPPKPTESEKPKDETIDLSKLQEYITERQSQLEELSRLKQSMRNGTVPYDDKKYREYTEMGKAKEAELVKLRQMVTQPTTQVSQKKATAKKPTKPSYEDTEEQIRARATEDAKIYDDSGYAWRQTEKMLESQRDAEQPPDIADKAARASITDDIKTYGGVYRKAFDEAKKQPEKTAEQTRQTGLEDLKDRITIEKEKGVAGDTEALDKIMEEATAIEREAGRSDSEARDIARDAYRTQSDIISKGTTEEVKNAETGVDILTKGITRRLPYLTDEEKLAILEDLQAKKTDIEKAINNNPNLTPPDIRGLTEAISKLLDAEDKIRDSIADTSAAGREKKIEGYLTDPANDNPKTALENAETADQLLRNWGDSIAEPGQSWMNPETWGEQKNARDIKEYEEALPKLQDDINKLRSKAYTDSQKDYVNRLNALAADKDDRVNRTIGEIKANVGIMNNGGYTPYQVESMLDELKKWTNNYFGKLTEQEGELYYYAEGKAGVITKYHPGHKKTTEIEIAEQKFATNIEEAQNKLTTEMNVARSATQEKIGKEKADNWDDYRESMAEELNKYQGPILPGEDVELAKVIEEVTKRGGPNEDEKKEFKDLMNAFLSLEKMEKQMVDEYGSIGNLINKGQKPELEAIININNDIANILGQIFFKNETYKDKLDRLALEQQDEANKAIKKSIDTLGKDHSADMNDWNISPERFAKSGITPNTLEKFLKSVKAALNDINDILNDPNPALLAKKEGKKKFLDKILEVKRNDDPIERADRGQGGQGRQQQLRWPQANVRGGGNMVGRGLGFPPIRNIQGGVAGVPIIRGGQPLERTGRVGIIPRLPALRTIREVPTKPIKKGR